MGKNYKFNPQAENDLNETYDWYECQQAGVGKKFIKEVKDKLEEISENPIKNPIYYKNVRKANLKRFPFSIIYLIQEVIISIIGVWHKKRDPVKLQDRINKVE